MTILTNLLLISSGANFESLGKIFPLILAVICLTVLLRKNKPVVRILWLLLLLSIVAYILGELL